MEFFLLGNDTLALEERLHDTKNLLRKYSKRKPHILLVGFFAFRGHDSQLLERLMTFSIGKGTQQDPHVHGHIPFQKNAGIT
jgi:hypothetical protein